MNTMYQFFLLLIIIVENGTKKHNNNCYNVQPHPLFLLLFFTKKIDILDCINIDLFGLMMEKLKLSFVRQNNTKKGLVKN